MDIYVQKDGQQQGPFTERQIREDIDAGKLAPSSLAWVTGKASWQPLSALIDLDTTKPPPSAVPAWTETPAPNPVPFRRRPSISPPPFRPPSDRPAHVNAPALAVSAPRFDHSSVQVDDATDASTLKSLADDLKTIRLTSIVYVVIILIDLVVGIWIDSAFLLTAAVLAGCTLGIWWGHSRIAAVFLLVFLCVGVVLAWLTGQGVGIWPVTVIQFFLTVKATEAVFRLNKRARQQRA